MDGSLYPSTMPPAPRRSPADRTTRRDELWLLELTSTPTAAGREERVMVWIDQWLAPRRARLDIRRDDAGNFLIQRKDRSRTAQPIIFTAHLDHPAFVVVTAPSTIGSAAARRTAQLEFRGGVNDPYFVKARIEVIDYSGSRHAATITTLDAAAKPFKRVTVRFDAPPAPNTIAVGDIGRWLLPAVRIAMRELPPLATAGANRLTRVIETHACDDLAAVAAACAAFDRLLKNKAAANLGLLFTVAEEVGFIGAIHAARSKFIPKNARLICLENSRSFPNDSPIGAGAIMRVGDRLSVFTPTLTNELSKCFTAHAKKTPAFQWQRKLMAGGACEATAFAAYGFESTCLCLPLGNYHNMKDIDGVAAGKRPAVIDCEFVAVSDFHALIEMLLVATLALAKAASTTSKTKPARPTHFALMEDLYERTSQVLGG
ncbi:MAG: hypothetical protein EXS17_03795 [Phycisphaerales bacterium]|nr:hypothetical protein [Phycisphaerales bacterium]